MSGANRVQSMQGFMYGSLAATTAGDNQVLTFAPDQRYQLIEVRFYSATTLADDTIAIEANGEQVYGGNFVPYPILHTSLSAVNAPTLGPYIWRPEVTVIYSRDRPLRFRNPATAPGTSAVHVVVHGITLGDPRA